MKTAIKEIYQALIRVLLAENKTKLAQDAGCYWYESETSNLKLKRTFIIGEELECGVKKNGFK